MAEGSLRLVQVRGFGERKDPDTGYVAEATFFIDVADTKSRTVEEYKLTAMDSRDYEAWKLKQRTLADQESEDKIEPLEVSVAQQLAMGGLAEYVRNRYLRLGEPLAINEVRSHLQGPIESQ